MKDNPGFGSQGGPWIEEAACLLWQGPKSLVIPGAPLSSGALECWGKGKESPKGLSGASDLKAAPHHTLARGSVSELQPSPWWMWLELCLGWLHFPLPGSSQDFGEA